MITTDDVAKRATQWIVSGDTGLSSKAIWSHMMDVRPKYGEYSHPYDPADLGRCLRLLELIPEWKPRFPEMATRSTAWARLVPEWDRIAQSMADEVGIDWSKGQSAKKTYHLMKDVLRG